MKCTGIDDLIDYNIIHIFKKAYFSILLNNYGIILLKESQQSIL